MCNDSNLKSILSNYVKLAIERNKLSEQMNKINHQMHNFRDLLDPHLRGRSDDRIFFIDGFVITANLDSIRINKAEEI